MDLKSGTKVTRHVRLVRPLGEGAMGMVWVGHHETLKADVAVKFISKSLVGDQASLDRFQREASISAQLKSPYVVQVFDQGLTEDGMPYIVMELLDGESLLDRLRRKGRLTPREMAMVLSQVAKALSRAHKIGVVHCDIKPDNIFLTTSEEGLFVRVLDFGIARRTVIPEQEPGDEHRTTPRRDGLFGTPEYMSREQILNPAPVDFRADLWALAVTTYQGITNKIPFAGETLGVVCAAIAKGDFVPPSRIAPVPSPLDAWFERTLNRDPVHRYGSAREMASSFARLAQTPSGEIFDELSSSGEYHIVSAGPGAGAGPHKSAGSHTEVAPSRRPIIIGIAAAAIAFAAGLFLLGRGAGSEPSARPSRSRTQQLAPSVGLGGTSAATAEASKPSSNVPDASAAPTDMPTAAPSAAPSRQLRQPSRTPPGRKTSKPPSDTGQWDHGF